MGFHIIACIKPVLTKAPDNGIIRTADTAEMNPFDRVALETALTIAGERKGTVTALSMGPGSCAFVLYEAMAMGVHRGVLLNDRRLADSDTLATSTALAGAITALAPFDLVVFGTRTADSDTGQVGPQTAVSLNLPLVTGACSLAVRKKTLRVERKMDEFREIYEVTLPAVLTIDPSSVRPRDIPLKGIDDAYAERGIEILTLDDIPITSASVGSAGSPTKVLSMKRVSRERRCEFIEGTMEEQADRVVELIGESGLVG